MPFEPGRSGNPAGGPVGSRHRQQLNGEFIAALLRDFRHGGPKAIERVRRTQPAAYLKILALLVPREHKVEHSNALKNLSDEQLEAMIAYLETSLEAQAGGPVKVIEGMIEPTTVPATALPVLEPPKRKPNRLMMEADTAIGPRERKPRKGAIACKHLTSQCLAATRGSRVCRQARPRHMLDCGVGRSLMSPDISLGDTTSLSYTVLIIYIIGLVID